MLEYKIEARRIDQHTSTAYCKQAEVLIDTDIHGREDAFNPAELLLASLAACILKNMERVAPIIHFEYRAVSVAVHAVRQDKPPGIKCIDYEILVDTDEHPQKQALMHDNIRKFGTVYNTLAATCELSGQLRRFP